METIWCKLQGVIKMTTVERENVFRILNAISNFVAGINNRMEYVVFPKEQRKMMDEIQNSLETMKFFDEENKENKQ